MIFHYTPSRVSVGIRFLPSSVRIAIALCSPRDCFTRRTANRVLQGRLNSEKEENRRPAHHNGRPRTITCISIPHNGELSREERLKVCHAVRDGVRKCKRRRTANCVWRNILGSHNPNSLPPPFMPIHSNALAEVDLGGSE